MASCNFFIIILFTINVFKIQYRIIFFNFRLSIYYEYLTIDNFLIIVENF